MAAEIGALFCPFCRLFGRDSADSERLHCTHALMIQPMQRTVLSLYFAVILQFQKATYAGHCAVVAQCETLRFQKAMQSVLESTIEYNVTILTVTLKTAVH